EAGLTVIASCTAFVRDTFKNTCYNLFCYYYTAIHNSITTRTYSNHLCTYCINTGSSDWIWESTGYISRKCPINKLYDMINIYSILLQIVSYPCLTSLKSNHNTRATLTI